MQSDNLLGKDLYRLMTMTGNEDGKLMSKENANLLLESLGYDGITHIGGQGRMKGTGKPQTHKVWIAFHPEQIHGALDLEAQAKQLQTPLPPHNTKPKE
jgi:hypothetical protein